MTETNGFGTHISLALPRQYNINRATTTEHSYLAYYYANTARSFTSELPFTSPPIPHEQAHACTTTGSGLRRLLIHICPQSIWRAVIFARAMGDTKTTLRPGYGSTTYRAPAIFTAVKIAGAHQVS